MYLHEAVEEYVKLSDRHGGLIFLTYKDKMYYIVSNSLCNVITTASDMLSVEQLTSNKWDVLQQD